MSGLSNAFIILLTTISLSKSQECNLKCPEGELNPICGFDVKGVAYKMFPSKCAMTSYSLCNKLVMKQTPIKFCIKKLDQSRRAYGESCPLFCPNHYRPVCGVSKIMDYVYRTFNNGCYLDMINCRGAEESSGYVEVPLGYCQRHRMKNIFKEKIVVTNQHDYREYE